MRSKKQVVEKKQLSNEEGPMDIQPQNRSRKQQLIEI